jgi:N-acetylmuramoyl-L-alanine amidase
MEIIRNIFIYISLLLGLLLFNVDVPFAQVALSTQPGLRVKTIYIDPSYGGKERGPVFAEKIYGKNLTLLFAQELKTVLSDAGFTVYLSRNGDKFISLDARVFRAKSMGADIYLAIKVSDRKKDCIRLLTTTEPNESKQTYKIESGKASELGEQVDKILKKLKNDSKYERSLELVQKLKIKLESDQSVNCVKMLQVYDYILLNADMPAVIADFGVLKQQGKSPYIIDTEEQDKIVHALADSIKAYSDEHAPPSSH